MSHRSQAMQVALESLSSDDDEFQQHSWYIITTKPKPMCCTVGGSIPGHIVINRERAERKNELTRDYFSDNPTYDLVFFLGGMQPSFHLILIVFYFICRFRMAR